MNMLRAVLASLLAAPGVLVYPYHAVAQVTAPPVPAVDKVPAVGDVWVAKGKFLAATSHLFAHDLAKAIAAKDMEGLAMLGKRGTITGVPAGVRLRVLDLPATLPGLPACVECRVIQDGKAVATVHVFKAYFPAKVGLLAPEP